MLNLEQQQDKERQFICPCGKSYFSYAALFTHVKQKHQGKAPGQIIKPMPENKRGRPRKTTPQAQTYITKQSDFLLKTPSLPQKFELSYSTNSTEDLKQPKFTFMPTAGSTFKHYQAQKAFVPIIQELPTLSSFQTELFQDLSKSLQFKILNSVPEILLKKQKTYLMLSEQAQNGDIIVCIRNFLKFCQNGVRKETHSQLVLLMSMLLQHIIDSQRDKEINELSTNQIHKHIISFFEYVTVKNKEIDLSPFDIFNSISTIKSLIVFFNWLNRFQAQQSAKHLVQSPGEKSFSDVIKLFQFYLRRIMDIVFSNRVSANIFKECAKAIIDQNQYHEAPIEMRKRIEDCLDIYIDHHAIIISGMEKVKIQPSMPPKS